MSAQRPSRTHKGCGLCHPNKRRGLGRAERDPFAVRRWLGKGRRLRRGELGD